MNAKIQKWGNSLGLRIPKHIAKQVNLSEGSSLIVAVENENIILSPQKKPLSLSVLVDAITPQNRHGEIEWGETQGKETW